MAALSITVAELLAGSGDSAIFESRNAGGTITAGQSVYLDATTNTYKLADSNDSAATAVVRGIALHAALAGQPLKIQMAGPITIGATAAMTVGQTYCIGTTAGSIVPISDLTTGDRVSHLGVATTAAILGLKINNSGALKP